MVQKKSSDLVLTNIRVFYAIAQEAYVAMKKEILVGSRPIKEGEPGRVHTYDPEQKSFKSAFIAIVFSGVCLEALLHLLIVDIKGLEEFKEVDRKESYAGKLRRLGCNDQAILDLCERFKTVRREILHEKAHLDSGTLRTAQEEAELAIDLVNKVFSFFKIEKS